MTTFARMCLCAAVALASAAQIQAQNVVAKPERIAEVLREAGYRAKIEGDTPKERYISSGSGGLDFTINFNGCNDAGAECSTVMFYAWFDHTAPSLEDMNMYSSLRRWGRFYIDKDGDPTMEMDLDLDDGGMSSELFIDNIEYWSVVLDDYNTFVASGVVPAE